MDVSSVIFGSRPPDVRPRSYATSRRKINKFNRERTPPPSPRDHQQAEVRTPLEWPAALRQFLTAAAATVSVTAFLAIKIFMLLLRWIVAMLTNRWGSCRYEMHRRLMNGTREEELGLRKGVNVTSPEEDLADAISNSSHPIVVGSVTVPILSLIHI